jgi:hypothetical protein
MKIFIRRVLVFGLLVLLVNAAYLLFMMRYDWNFSKRMESLRLGSPQNEVLVLGNSLAMDGIDTDLMTREGIPAYNMALGGASLQTSYVQLEEYLERYTHKPRIVLLGLSEHIGSFERSGINPIVEYTMKGYSYGLKDLPMVRFRWLFLEALKKVVSKSHREAVIVRGQLKFRKQVKDKTLAPAELPEFNLAMYQQAEWLKKIAGLCKTHQIRLVLIEMPGFKAFRNRSSNGPFTLAGAEFSGVDVYNFNSAEFCKKFEDQEDWIGKSHLNEAGAGKFTRSLLEVLRFR